MNDHHSKVLAVEKDIQPLMIRCHHHRQKAQKFHHRQGIIIIIIFCFCFVRPNTCIIIYVSLFSYWFRCCEQIISSLIFPIFCSYRYRVVLFGDAGTGKTALVSQFMTSEYMHTYDASLGKFDKPR